MHSTRLAALFLSVGYVFSQDPAPAPTGSAMIRVVDKHGGPITNYAVRPLVFSTKTQPYAGAIPEHGEQLVEPRNLHDGGYLLRGLPAATLIVRIDALGFPRAVSEPFCVTAGTTCEVRVQLTGGGAIAGRILDNKDRGLANAVVATADWWDASHTSLESRIFFQPYILELTTKAETITDATGTFTLPRLALGNYALRFHHAGFCDHVERGIKVSVGKPRELPSIVLEPGAQITGVASLAGTPQVCLVSLCVKEGERHLALAEIESSAEGKFTLPRRVRPGDYTISYTPIDEVGRWSFKFSRSIQFALKVEAGQTIVTVQEPAADN